MQLNSKWLVVAAAALAATAFAACYGPSDPYYYNNSYGYGAHYPHDEWRHVSNRYCDADGDRCVVCDHDRDACRPSS